jgi:Tol biopolymer transport system component
MTLTPGTKLGPYEIVAPLGAGGMGEVYRARDTRLGRDVAVKVLPAHLAATPEVRARFEREARAVSSLNHPHICTLYDVGRHEGIDYLVMEHLDGETLAARLTRGTLPAAELLRYAIEIAEALDAAHRSGIVHRDLKPGNIMLTKSGTKLLDFGLARATGLAAGSENTQSPTVSRPLTAEGTIVGTFQYMSPEQLEGSDADARSDIFAFGAVLYEMATGRRAFEGKSQASLIAAILDKDPPPISAIAPLVPPALDRVVQRCLAKSPDDRWQTARDLAHELRWVRDDSSRVASAPARSSGAASDAQRDATNEVDARGTPAKGAARARRLALALVIIAALAAATSQIVRVMKPRSPRINPQMTLRPVQLPLTQIGYPGLSQDGRWIALPAADERGKWDVYFMNASGGEVRRITNDPDRAAAYADVSTDGSQVAYSTQPLFGESEIRVVSSLGGSSRVIATGGDAPHWSPDGRRVGYLIGTFQSRSGFLELWSVGADGSDNRLEFADSLCSSRGRISFSWSPDGKRIAWLRSFEDGAYQELIVRDLATGSERQLTSDKKNIDEVCWTLQDDIVFSSNRSGNTNLWIVRASGGSLVQVTKGLGPDIGMRISADGEKLLYLEARPISHLWFADIVSGTTHQVTYDDLVLGIPALSPDHQRIAVPIYDPDPIRRSGHIFVMNRDGGDRRQVSFGEGRAQNPSWSPDGTRLVFSLSLGAVSPDSTGIFVVQLSNPTAPRRVAMGTQALWIDERTLLVLTRTRTYQISADGSGVPHSFSQDSTYAVPSVTPGYEVFFDLHDGREGLWIRDPASTSGGERPPARRVVERVPFAVAPDGSYVIFFKDPGRIAKIVLPEGKEEPIEAQLPGFTYVSAGNTSHDARAMVYLEPRTASKLVLIENLR